MQSWFNEEAAQAVAISSQAAVNASFVSVAITVPSRFISQLGSPLPTSAIALSVAQALGVSSVDVIDIVVS